jgi:tetratricopeptide (TPR) repeat protein
VRSDEAARKFGIKEGMLMALARRYAEGDATDFDSALGGLERALEVAAVKEARGDLPSNLGEAVDAVLKRMAELNELGELDAAAVEVDRALEAAEAQGEALEARKAALLEAGLDQDILRRNPTSAAARLVARLGLEVAEGAARFAALRALWLEWYERGRDKGLNFDAEVAVALAQASVDLVQGADQRGRALNELGTALATVGEREAGTGRLEEAVTAFRDALKEWTRKRVPLDWATAQMNLGNALQTLGTREAGTGRLEEAVTAFRNALKERTRERVPLDWAMVQVHLVNVECAFFDKAQDVARRDAAEAYARAALAVFEEAGASRYVQMSEQQLAGIAARRA